MKQIFILFLTLPLMLLTKAQQIIPLYDNQVPNSRPAKDQEVKESNKDNIHISISRVSHPMLTIFLPPPEKANGTAVVICPGGGYVNLAIGHEGYEIAKKLNDCGVAAFVLKYRLPSDSTMIDKQTGPLQDAQRAIQMVRQNAAAWKVNPARIGIMGFSAGGHLASTAGTHFTNAVIDNPAHTSLRPDFMILLYPVISFADSITHQGSKNNLLGPQAASDKVWEYSNELQVSPQTPPTFLVHAGDDTTVPVQNSLFFYEALLHNSVPAELHIYPKGGHGFGLHNPTTKDEWFDRLKNWMDSNGWLTK